MRRFGRVVVAAMAVFGGMQSANAATVFGGEALGQYNLIVLGDLVSSSEVEGRTFVGGNLSGNSSNYQIRTVTGGAGAPPALTVVGSVQGNSKNINNGGGALVGGNVENPFNLNGPNQTVRVGGTMELRNVNGNTVQVNQNADPAFGQDLAARRQALTDSFTGPKGLSAQLSGLATTPATGSVAINGNRATFTATGTGLNVIALDGASLGRFGEIAFSNAGTTVVNVSGTSLTFDDNFLGNASGLGQKVIWNLFEAKEVSFGNAFYGSVLAPLANGTLRNFIEGSAVFGNLRQDGELHLATFNGTLPATGAVPEPATWAMMILGVGMAGGMLRRRHRAVHAVRPARA